MSGGFEEFAGPFVCGLLIGGAVWQLAIGTALVRRGRFTHRAWNGRHLATRPRTQGWGYLAGALLFILAGAGYGFGLVLGGGILGAGLVILLLLNVHLEPRARSDDSRQETLHSAT